MSFSLPAPYSYVYLFFVCPAVVFFFHNFFISFLIGLAKKGSKHLITFSNMFIYPFIASLLVSSLLKVVLWNRMLLVYSVSFGVFAYYLSVLFAFIPVLSEVFTELPMEFFMLSIGCVSGVSVHGIRVLYMWIYQNMLKLLFAAIVAVFMVWCVKFRFRQVYVDYEQYIQDYVLVTSVASSLAFMPVIIFFMMNYLR